MQRFVNRTNRTGRRLRWPRVVNLVLLGALSASPSCDDSVAPSPPKQENIPPETFLQTMGDSLLPQFYELPLSWLGSDADGRVTGYRWRWLCEPGMTECLVDSAWQQTERTSEVFRLPVPEGSARYIFEIAAIDDDGVVDATPERQLFTFFNTNPVGRFKPGTVPLTSLPAVTFFFESADPDSTLDDSDGDSQATLSHYEVWLDGSEDNPTSVPIETGSVTLRLEDFEDRFGARTLYMRVVDGGGAKSPTVEHTWEVESAPVGGVLLVDDCRQGGAIEEESDASYRAVIEAALPEVYRLLDIEALPSLRRDDLDATLSLFDKIIWYTDGDISSSGALEFARDALLALLEERQGKLLLCSGLAFGSQGAFGPLEERFRALFGINKFFVAPDSTTNFPFQVRPIVEARVHDGLTQFRIAKFGLDGGSVMECFDSIEDEVTRTLYFYPESVYRFFNTDNTEFVNPEQFDIGVYRSSAAGARAAYVSFPLGWGIRADTGDNRTEILELLRLLGIVEP